MRILIKSRTCKSLFGYYMMLIPTQLQGIFLFYLSLHPSLNIYDSLLVTITRDLTTMHQYTEQAALLPWSLFLMNISPFHILSMKFLYTFHHCVFYHISMIITNIPTWYDPLYIRRPKNDDIIINGIHPIKKLGDGKIFMSTHH